MWQYTSHEIDKSLLYLFYPPAVNWQAMNRVSKNSAKESEAPSQKGTSYSSSWVKGEEIHFSKKAPNNFC